MNKLVLYNVSIKLCKDGFFLRWRELNINCLFIQNDSIKTDFTKSFNKICNYLLHTTFVVCRESVAFRKSNFKKICII